MDVNVESPPVQEPVLVSPRVGLGTQEAELTWPARLLSTLTRPSSRECVRCHQVFPTQELVIEWQRGTVRVPQVVCWRRACNRCVEIELANAEQYRKQQEQTALRDRWEEAGLTPGQWRQTMSSFDAQRLAPRADGTTAADDAAWLTAHTTDDPAPWLVLWGERGKGKTHLAVAVLIEVCRRGGRGLFRTGKEMMDELRATHEPGALASEAELQRQWARLSLVVIDDVGVERQTAYTAEAYWAVVDGRYRTGTPLVLTTNLTPDGLMAHIGEAAASRLAERALVCEVQGAGDYRLALRQGVLVTAEAGHAPTPIGPHVVVDEPADVPF